MIMETRRQFLLDAATLGAGLAFGAAPAACRKPLLRVGIASDLHIRRSASVDTGKDNWSSDRFERVLSVYRDLGADAIMVPGDIADWGLVSQLVEAGLAWDRVFPGGRGLGGKKVEKLFIYGNHDYFPAFRFSEKPLVKKYLGLDAESARCAYAKTDGISNDYAKAWETAFHEPWTPTFAKTVNGFTFFGANWGSEGKSLAKLVGEMAPTLDSSRPFFIFQHRAFSGTCWSDCGISPRALDADDGSTTAVLRKYPNAFAFSGHNHYTLADRGEFWGGPFAAFGCSSLRFLAKVPPPGGWPKGTEFWDSHIPKAYQSLFLSVYDDEVVVEAHEWRDGSADRLDVVPAWHIRRTVS